MVCLKLGLIASLSGKNQRVGTGIRDSLAFIVKRSTASLGAADVDIELIAHDDHSSPLGVIAAFERCVSDGCVAVVGPSDSEAMHALLSKKKFGHVPVISTLATATDLVPLGCRNLVRLTTPNVQRVDLLLRQIATMYPGKTVEVFAATGLPQCFSQSLKRDVVLVAEQHKLTSRVQDFSVGGISVEPPATDAPLLICAVSADAIQLLRRLREDGCKNQAFSFGSNTNWLATVAVGTVVVCDLDRQGSDPRVRDYLREFRKECPSSKDPSLPTMNAGHIVVHIAKKHAQLFGDSIDRNRREMMTRLRTPGLDGLFGAVSITPDGEMSGHEQITLLKVHKRGRAYYFKGLGRDEKPLRWKKRSNVTAIVAVVGIVSSIAGLPYAKDLGEWLLRVVGSPGAGASQSPPKPGAGGSGARAQPVHAPRRAEPKPSGH